MRKGISNVKCGSTSKYRMGCRCEACSQASKNYWKEFRIKYKERLLVEGRENHKRNKVKRNAECRNYWIRKSDILKAKTKEKRIIVLMHYSNKTMSCACCGEDTYHFLSLDHINNGGNKHRKEIKGRIEPTLIKANFPEGYQVLCHNCNMGKRLNGGICPHKS